MASCGTNAGYREHMRKKQLVDAECRQAIRDYNTAYRRRRGIRSHPTQSEVCGTNAGFERHRRIPEAPCDSCRDANRSYQRQRYDVLYLGRLPIGHIEEFALFDKWGTV